MIRTGFIFSLLAVVFLAGTHTYAQPSSRVRPIIRGEGKLDPEEGRRILEEFKASRPGGDYIWDFDLRYMPRRGKSIYFFGQMMGTWNESGPRTRFNILTREMDDSQVNLLFQSGSHPAIWLNKAPLTLSTENAPEARMLTGSALIKPVIEGLTFTPLEMQSQFIYWKDWIYEGKDISGRTLHVYLMSPPEELTREIPDLGAVRIFIDQQFGAMTKAEILDVNGDVTKTFKVLAFARVDEQYLVKTIDLIDEKTRDKTRFDVVAARMGLNLDESIFDPKNLAMIPPLQGIELERIR